jgi:hypothetical protein
MKAGNYHVVAASSVDPSKTASAAVKATAPAPAFSSTAPTAAAEGTVYNYPPTATDPVNTAITFSLVSGPVGAAIKDNILTWTPTHEQSRTSNAFEIAATTAAGGTAGQKFTVTPSGIIRGTAVDTYITATGSVTAPENLSAAYIGISFPNGNGWTTVQGAGNPDGTFTVAGVPSGNYWLAVASGGYWTSASDIDLGQDFLGRNDGVLASNGTSLALNFVGLDTWKPDDTLDIYNPNLSQDFDWSDNINPGDTMFGSVWNWTGPLSNAAKGDAWYVTQKHRVELGSISWRAAATTTPGISITQSDGTATALGGDLAPATQIPVHMAVQGSQFAAAASSLGPDASVHSTTIGVYSQPFSSAKGAIGQIEDILETEDQTPLTVDVDFGDISVGNPFPATWSTFADATYEIAVPYTATGATGSVDAAAELYVSSTQLPTKDTPLTPAVTPVLNIKLNGTAFTNRQSVSTLTPTLAWDVPTTGTPTGYRMTVNRLSITGSGSAYQPVLDLFTNDRTIVIPDGVLTAGNEYFFIIRAYLVPSVDFTTAPYHAAFPWSHADMLTPVVSTVGAAPSATSGPAALKNIIRGPLSDAPRGGNARHAGPRSAPRIAVMPN